MRLDQKVDLVQNFLGHNEKDGGGDKNDTFERKKNLFASSALWEDVVPADPHR